MAAHSGGNVTGLSVRERGMTSSVPYGGYWQRKRMLEQRPRFPVVRWWSDEKLCEIEEIYYNAVKQSRSILDIGAGNLCIRRKFLRAGYQGRYDTLDIGAEYSYTYDSLSAVKCTYEAIICLDVVEHMSLQDALTMIRQACELLAPGGVLVLQTPNARCIRSPLGWDMTHLHCYNPNDLWAYLSDLELDVTVYRVVFGREHPTVLARLKSSLSAYIIAHLLGCDYADNIGAIAHKSGPTHSER
jgi:hypothetical protein